MALRNLRRKQAPAVEEVDEVQLQEFRSSHRGAETIAEARPRQPITVVGEVTSVRVIPKHEGSPWLEATISDDTGKLVVLWTGRRSIAGVQSGARLAVTGRPSPSGPGGRLLIYNPIYELL